MKRWSSEALESRTAGVGVNFVGTPRPCAIEAGDGVTLKSAGVTIMCEVKGVDPNGEIVGMITGFERVPDVTFKGMTIDDEISFKKEHVIGCSKLNVVVQN